MRLRSRKLTVLHQLSQESDPISLEELLQKLDGNQAERSVRRWLADMVQEGLVEKLGSKRATRYKVLQRANRHVGAISRCFRSESEGVLKLVRRPIYERIPIAYADEWLNTYVPNITFYIPLELRLQ
ncbi:MAG TPA: hypothetical protein VIJ46_03315, partial [Rhabdochlamydiaceae bacterium]